MSKKKTKAKTEDKTEAKEEKLTTEQAIEKYGFCGDCNFRRDDKCKNPVSNRYTGTVNEKDLACADKVAVA